MRKWPNLAVCMAVFVVVANNRVVSRSIRWHIQQQNGQVNRYRFNSGNATAHQTNAINITSQRVTNKRMCWPNLIYRDNGAMVEVFYEQLNFELLRESEAYGVCFIYAIEGLGYVLISWSYTGLCILWIIVEKIKLMSN
jgi:hypothetical protein